MACTSVTREGVTTETHDPDCRHPMQAQNVSNAAWWQEHYGDDFTGCVEAASGKVDNPEGFCAQVHYDATGHWPGEKKAAVTAAQLEPLSEPFPTPEYPPAQWFDRPEWLQPGQGLTITDDGQVAGYWYEHGACLVHDPGACPKPSPTGYALFHQQTARAQRDMPASLVGSPEVEQVEDIQVGVIGSVGGHASPYSTVAQAQQHYSNPDCQKIVCRAGDDEHGGWIAGALVPGLTYGDVAFLRRCALSGDWRPMDRGWWDRHGVDQAAIQAADGYDSLGPTLVNRPALPLVKRFQRAASARAADGRDTFVFLGGNGGVQLPDDVNAYGECAECSEEEPVTATSETVPATGGNPEAAVSAAAPPPFAKKDGDKPTDKATDTPSLEDIDRRLKAVEAKLSKAAAAEQAALREQVDSLDRPELPPEYPFIEEELDAEGQAVLAAASKADMPKDDRKKLADKGKAMPDDEGGGSFPITNVDDLKRAKAALGRAGPKGSPGYEKARRWINKRAKELGQPGVGEDKKAA